MTGTRAHASQGTEEPPTRPREGVAGAVMAGQRAPCSTRHPAQPLIRDELVPTRSPALSSPTSGPHRSGTGV